MPKAARKILVIDDEAPIRNMLGIFLGATDFDVIECADGRQGLRQAIAHKPDLILLDLGLPDIDGKDILKSLRQWTQTPVIVLTARDNNEETALALNLGADDYITKPFHAEVLLARINANLRARPVPEGKAILSNGPIRIDLVRHEVRINNQLTALTPKEFDLLSFFTTHRGKVLTHRQILTEVWGKDHVDDTQYLRVYIGMLRDKLEVADGLAHLIISENGVGYRMDALPAPDRVAA